MKYFKIIFICALFLLSENLFSEEFKVVTIRKDTIDLMKLSENNHLFIITYTYGYSCFDCFIDIVKNLDSLQKKYDENTKYVFLSKTKNNSQARRSEIENIGKIKPNLDVYFDIYDEDDKNSGLFAKYKISTTPSIFYIHNSKINYISFDKLNNSGNYYSILKDIIK